MSHGLAVGGNRRQEFGRVQQLPDERPCALVPRKHEREFLTGRKSTLRLDGSEHLGVRDLDATVPKPGVARERSLQDLQVVMPTHARSEGTPRLMTVYDYKVAHSPCAKPS